MGFVKDFVRRSVGFNPVGWEQARRQMRMRVEEYLPDMPERPDGPDTLVVVAPWLDTPVPWFTMAVGMMLAERGSRVRFVIDDLPYTANAFRHATVLAAIRHAMEPLAARFEVQLLSNAPKVPLTEADSAEVQRLAQLNATWTLRGEMPEKGRAQLIERAVAQSGLAQQHIAGFFRENDAPDLLFTPGGIFGHSGLWMRAGQAAGARIASFDSGGQKAMLVDVAGKACQADDMPLTFRLLKEDGANDPASLDFALERGREELAKRRAGKDTFGYQVSGAAADVSRFAGGVLIALNSSWDAAALGPHRAYPTNSEWILGSVRYLLENTDKPVIVRQHPAERHAIASTNDDYAALLRDGVGEHERLHFIAAEDPVNSYTLLEQVSAVVVHTSTIGIEAVAFGRPVITGSKSYYADLGFVNFADDRTDYEALLQQAAQGNLAPTDEMKRDAELCFYLTQVCKWVFTPFNPANLNEWLAEPLSHWAQQETVERVLKAIKTGVPVATLTHRASIVENHAG